MTAQIKQYIPESGILVASNNGSQRVTTDTLEFTYRSPIDFSVNVASKVTIDSAWETGNILRIVGNVVSKTTFSGTSISSAVFTNPNSLSVSQKRLTIPQNVAEWTDEAGCWVTDSYENKLYLLNANLVIVKTLSGLTHPVQVVSSDFDHGCFVFDDGTSRAIKINSAGIELGFHTYAALADSISAFPSSALLANKILVDGEGSLWYLYNNILTKVVYNNGLFDTLIHVRPLTDLSLSPAQYNAVDFDIARGVLPNKTVVTGGAISNSNSFGKTWMANYNSQGFLTSSQINIQTTGPRLIQVSQMSSTNSVYLVTKAQIINLMDYFPLVGAAFPCSACPSCVSECQYCRYLPVLTLINTLSGAANLVLVEDTIFDDNIEVNGILIGPLCSAPTHVPAPYAAPAGTILASNIPFGSSANIYVVDHWGFITGVRSGGTVEWIPS